MNVLGSDHGWIFVNTSIDIIVEYRDVGLIFDEHWRWLMCHLTIQRLLRKKMGKSKRAVGFDDSLRLLYSISVNNHLSVFLFLIICI